MKKVVLILLALGIAQWWFKNPSISVPSNDVSFSYIVKYSGKATRDRTLPMLLALHGDGDSAKNFYATALDLINAPSRIILLEGPLSRGGGKGWPYDAAGFAQYGQAVSEAAKLLALKYPTTGKPILLGFSGGGAMAYYQALKHGDVYSTIFPVSADLCADVLGNTPYRSGAEVHAFHGKSDRLVSLSNGKDTVDLLQRKGVKVKFTEFKGGHLGIFTTMKPAITQSIEATIYSLW